MAGQDDAACEGKNSALFLDIDGTLLDMARTPDAVEVPARICCRRWKSFMTRWRARWPLSAAVRWARSTDCLRRSRTAAIGCHGARSARRRRQCPGPGRAHSRSGARICSRGLAESHPGTLLEDKIYALALHYRLAPEARRRAGSGDGKTCAVCSRPRRSPSSTARR